MDAMSWWRSLRSGVLTARTASAADRPAVSALLASAWRRHGITALEEQIALLNGGASAVAFAGPDMIGFLGLFIREPAGDPEETWADVAMAASAGQVAPAKTMSRMLQAVMPVLRVRRVTALAALADGSWLNTALSENGFVEVDQVVSYARRNSRHLPEAAHPATLRPAGPADTDAVLEINAAAFEPLWRYDPATIITWLTTAEHAVIAELGGRPVGFSLTANPLHGDYAQLIRVATHPSVQGRGIGRQLVADTIRFAEENGCSGICLNTQASNGIARELYRSLDFRPTPAPLTVLVRPVRDARAPSF
jgi:ribosomal protein S18 acetylase RimI-like enzyme